MNNQTFGDFICLMTYNNVLGRWVTSHRTYIYVLSRQGSNESHNNEQKMPSILTGIIIIHNNNTVNRWVLVERMFFSLRTMHFFLTCGTNRKTNNKQHLKLLQVVHKYRYTNVTLCQREDFTHTLSSIPYSVKITRLSEQFDKLHMWIIVVRIALHLKKQSQM